jgi:hypothetical protein
MDLKQNPLAGAFRGRSSHVQAPEVTTSPPTPKVPPAAVAHATEVEAITRRLAEVERRQAEASAGAVERAVSQTAVSPAATPNAPPRLDDAGVGAAPADEAVKAATESANPGNPNAILHIPTVAERTGGADGQKHFTETELIKSRLALSDWYRFQLPKLIESGVMQISELESWPDFEGIRAIVENARSEATADASMENSSITDD